MPARIDILGLRKTVVMVTRARASRGRQVLIPTDEELHARRSKLPKFEPYDTRQLFEDAREAAANRGIDLDTAVKEIQGLDQTNQIEQLLTNLRCDPKKPDWEIAFHKLARIYCDVGRLVHRPRVLGSGARTWTPEADFNLLMEVHRLKGEGHSERQAVEFLAENPGYNGIFPYREQTPGRRTGGRKQRAAALHKHLRRLMQRASGPWELFRGSYFELFLNPPPRTDEVSDN
jgi:hypothetical protein